MPPHIIIPVNDLNALKSICIDNHRYHDLTKNAWAKVLLAFCPEGHTENQDMSVRVFPIAYGIAEDPATGSGNGCLAAYLVKIQYLEKSSIDITVGQGYEMGRPSQLKLKASETNATFSIHVGGNVIPIAEGAWE